MDQLRRLFGFKLRAEYYWSFDDFERRNYTNPNGWAKDLGQEIISALKTGHLFWKWSDQVTRLTYSQDPEDAVTSFDDMLCYGYIFNPLINKIEGLTRMEEWGLPFDPIDTEYAYIINYDSGQLDIYQFIWTECQRYRFKSVPLEISALTKWCQSQAEAN